MNVYQFDFYTIATVKDFYTVFVQKVKPSMTFGNNLDALYDVLTGEMVLPATIEWINLSLPQLEVFDTVIATIESAVDELNEALNFTYSIRPMW